MQVANSRYGAAASTTSHASIESSLTRVNSATLPRTTMIRMIATGISTPVLRAMMVVSVPPGPSNAALPILLQAPASLQSRHSCSLRHLARGHQGLRRLSTDRPGKP